MPQKTMQIVIGAPATGSNYFPRPNISQKLQRALHAEHVLFLAPRRTGKTSILLDLQRNSSELAVFLNLEKFNHPKQWINEMIRILSEIKDSDWQQKFKQLSDLLPRLKTKYVELAEADWEEKGRQLMTDLQKLDAPIWFLLDEFPIMIDQIAKTHNIALAESALHWIRHLRQQYPESRIRFLLTGSIGLDSVLRRHGIRGTTNDLRREVLTPLTSEEALNFAMRLTNDNGVTLTEDLAQTYLNRLGIGLWPFFIQLFIAELQDTQPAPTTPTEIEALYQKIVRGSRNQYASNMWDRLKDTFGDVERDAARKMLKHVATQPEGVALSNLRTQQPQLEEDDFNYVLDVLQHDGYLTESGSNGNIGFHSNLLRDFWLYKGRV